MAVGDPEEARNFRLLGHAPEAGWGGGSLVEVKDGFAYVGAIGLDGREGFTVHDVSDPAKPKLVAEVPADPGIHNHKVRIVGDDLLYVNSECLKTPEGEKARGGCLIYDISDPSSPRRVGFYDLPGRGPHRFGVDNERQLAFFPNEAEGWRNRVIWTLDIKDPLKPEVVSVWGLPEQRLDHEPPFADSDPMERVWTCHGPPFIRGDRMYCGFWGGGMAVIDCADLSDMKLVSHLCWSPPFVGSTHTVWPVGDRPYVVATDEARSHTNYPDSQFLWVIDIREDGKPIPVAAYFPDREKYMDRGGRFGAHNIIENIPAEGPWANLVFLTYFNAGLRAVDISDPLSPREAGCYVPASDFGKPAVQSNDICADADGRLYLIDRWGGGMHILEYTG